jgi:hypothetical protein
MHSLTKSKEKKLNFFLSINVELKSRTLKSLILILLKLFINVMPIGIHIG